VEANLVNEEEQLLVEARPIRRKRQIVIIVLVAVAVIAIIIGVSVGFVTKRPPLPTTPAPTPAPTSQLDALFLPTLPPYTLASLQNMSSPQSLAYEWATEVDQLPWIEAPFNESLRLARMKQRFALATLFFATGGNQTWKRTEGWLNATVHECEWEGCCCYAACYYGYDEDGILDDDESQHALAWLGLRA
jgi:hypothetical protein